jgi:hypothetical protein
MDCRDIYFSPKVEQEYYASGNAYRKRLCEAGLTSNRDIIFIGGSAGATAPLKEIPSRIRSACSGRGLHNPLQGVEILTKAASNVARGLLWSSGPLRAGKLERLQNSKCTGAATPILALLALGLASQYLP